MAVAPSLGVEPPRLTWPEPGGAVRMACPNCGSDAPKTPVLGVTVQLPANPRKELWLLRCPDCTARFYDDQAPPDYAEPALNDLGRVPFYVQQGAGLNLLIRPLAQVRRHLPCTYMEVGCGYGFGLDYAVNTRGWEGTGIDPAPLAALGRAALALPIQSRYLQEDDEARGTMDVVAGSEVIEHVTSPAGFLRTLKAMLQPRGVLVLTTPNGDDVRPDVPPGVLVPLLSPGLHLILQSQASLQSLLEQAGFAHLRVEVDGHSLVGFASDSPFDLETDARSLRAELRRHLQLRAATTDPAGDPFLGFAGRAFLEGVNDGDWAAADEAWERLVPACLARYGLDLDAPLTLPSELGRCGLDEMVRLIPLNLPGLLYGSAIRSLAAGTPRAALEPRFMAAANAATALRRALRELAMEDGQTEEIGWAAAAEAVLCAAEAGAADLPARCAPLPAAPSGGDARRRQVLLRALTVAVNAGHYRLAAELARSAGLARHPALQPRRTDRTDTERDALYALGIMGLNLPDAELEPGGLSAARERLERARDHTSADSGLWRSALQAEAVIAERLAQPAASNRSLLRRAWEASGGLRHDLLPAVANRLLLRQSPQQTLYRWPDHAPALEPKVCVFAHWDANGTVRADVQLHLRELAAHGFSLLFVSNSGVLRPKDLDALRSVCAGVLVRRNAGHDFGAWREAFEQFELPRSNTELLVLANDSVYGPIQPLGAILDAIDPAQADVWACTESCEIAYHLQSYWLALNRNAITSPAWRAFWAQVRPAWSKRWLIRRYEIGLTQALLQAGLRCRAIWTEERVRRAGWDASPAATAQAARVAALAAAGRPINPVTHLWRPLLRTGFPFIKRELLHRNPARVLDVAEWRQVLEEVAPGFDPACLERDAAV